VFDPNSAAEAGSGIFGLPFTEKEAAMVFLPVSWEATVSYGSGTANAPRAILEASVQVDLEDADVIKPYEAGLFMLPESPKIRTLNRQARAEAKKIIASSRPNPRALQTVNKLGTRLNDYVHGEAARLLKAGKIPALIGGDHSSPYGMIKAVGENTPSFGLLHFDAHHDMRDAYEGFQWSHASILRNVLDDIPQVKKLVQVGIRDFCEEERAYCESQSSRVRIFYDADLNRKKFSGEPFDKTAREIAGELPQKVWITFDIDGLSPAYCPHTGTPVPGGLDFTEAAHLISTVVRSGRQILGFDLVEVAPDPDGKSEWDANVAARLLYKMSALTLASRKLARLRS
jgi:agmatinase